MTNWENRIVGHGTKAASEFTPNPHNLRRHPQRQRDAMYASLNNLGWIAPVIVNIHPDSGYLIDGHERVMQALGRGDDTPVPYIEVNLEPNEERLALASFDFITSLAEYDREATKVLLQSIQTDDENMRVLLDTLAEDTGAIPPNFSPLDIDNQPRLDQLEPKMIVCPCCGEEFDLRNVKH